MSPDRERLLQPHIAAADYYTDSLASRHAASPREYLAHRGVAHLEGTETWRIGYAPPGWTALTGHLHERGFTDTELLSAGLAVPTQRGTVVDRFRDRLMFGLRDVDGNLVGFIGRAAPGAAADVPRYLNSPRTPIFDKSRVLFGLHEQRDELATGALPVLVEGPFDVLAIAVVQGFAGVAPCGTAVTSDQVRLLADAGGHRVIAAFDGDHAGRRAACQAYARLAAAFTDVRSARLPAGQDPAAIAASDPGRLRGLLRSTHPLADDLVDDVLDHYAPKLDNAEARVCGLHEVSRVLAHLVPTDVSRQVVRVSTRLNLTAAQVTSDLADAVTTQPPRAATRPSAPAVHRHPAQTRGPRAALHQ